MIFFFNLRFSFYFIQIGLNSAFAGGFLYVLFGTIKQVSIGPTSLMSLLTMEYTKNFPPEYIHHYVFLLTFMCGCVELIMGIFRLGKPLMFKKKNNGLKFIKPRIYKSTTIPRTKLVSNDKINNIGNPLKFQFDYLA